MTALFTGCSLQYPTLLLLLCFGPGQSLGQQANLVWVAEVQGDVDTAPFLKRRSLSIPSYVVLFDSAKFNPFGEVAYADSSAGAMPDMILLTEIPPDTELFVYQLNIHALKYLPFCTDCDVGCYGLKDTITQSASIQVQSGPTVCRYLFSISDMIRDWHLQAVSVHATLTLNGIQKFESRIKVAGWPWCD